MEKEIKMEKVKMKKTAMMKKKWKQRNKNAMMQLTQEFFLLKASFLDQIVCDIF